MNRKAHMVVSAAATASVLAVARHSNPAARVPHPAFGAAVAAITASLPDLIEPATSPNHRQFFHSATFAGGLLMMLRRVYDWNPTTPFEQFVRDVLLCVGISYLVHIGVDATTAKSIPWLGQIAF